MLNVLVITRSKMYTNPGQREFFRSISGQRTQSGEVLFSTRCVTELGTTDVNPDVVIVEHAAIYESGYYEATPSENKSWDRVMKVLEKADFRILDATIDLHGISSRLDSKSIQLDHFIDLRVYFDAIMWPFEHGVIGRDSVDLRFRESWMDAAEDPLRVHSAIKTTWDLRVNFNFAVTVRRPRSEAIRPFRIGVPGTGYASRKIARRQVAKSLSPSYPYSTLDRVIRFGTFAARQEIHENELAIALRRANQQTLLNLSRATYVCGSGYGYPVAKFFEIPAAGSAPIGILFPGAEDLGFFDGRTFLEVDPEGIGDFLRDKNFNCKVRNVAAAAQRMVADLHSYEARLDQLAEILRLLLAGHCGAMTLRDYCVNRSWLIR